MEDSYEKLQGAYSCQIIKFKSSMIDPKETPEQIIQILKEFTIWASKARKRNKLFLKWCWNYSLAAGKEFTSTSGHKSKFLDGENILNGSNEKVT